MYCLCSKCREYCEEPCVRQETCPGTLKLSRPCCCSYKNIKVRGKFGLAYVIETPRTKYCKPFGWQVEFQDTPSRIDYNCKKMVKWVTSPPLGECNSAETNFWCYPEECGEFLKNEMGRSCHYGKKSVCETPKIKCVCPNKVDEKLFGHSSPRCCITGGKVCQTEKRPELSQKCNCFADECCYCLNRKQSCVCFKKSNHCKKCKFKEKCECSPQKDDLTGQSPSKPPEKKLQCKYCKCHTYRTSMSKCCSSCYIEEQICTYCGRTVAKSYFVKKEESDRNCDIDYIPKKDCMCSNGDDKTSKQAEDNNDKANNNEDEAKRGSLRKGSGKNLAKKECGCDIESNDNANGDKESRDKDEKNEDGDTEKVIKTTYYDGKSLLERIKNARKKQLDIIHGSPRTSV